VLPEPGVCERYEQETIDIEEVENAA
jgi:hypothetical protein